MIEYLDLEDRTATRVVFHRNATRAVAKIDGLAGLSPPREARRARPTAHGSTNRQRYLDDKLVLIEGEVWGASQEAAWAEYGVLEAALYDALDTDRLLRYRHGSGGPDLQMKVRLAADVKTSIEGGGRFLKYQAQLRASDPRAYSQTLVVAPSAPMGNDGGGFTFPVTWPAGFVAGNAGIAPYENDGTVDAPVVFRLYGRLVNPRVQLVGDAGGRQIVLNGTVARGDFLELDSERRKVLLNGTVNRANMRDFAASSWFGLPKGVGTVRLLADDADADAYMTVAYAPAYGG